MPTEAESHPVRLRYFACRSRGQALRFALTDAGVAFDDVRIPITELDAFRQRAHSVDVGGPFASLPVLEWHGLVVAQTLAIANYLAAKLGPAADLRTAEERSFFEMVTCAAHLDMQVPYSQLLWLGPDEPRDALRAAGRRLLDQLEVKLGQLERLLVDAGHGGPFFGSTTPVVADYFVYESVSRAVDVFGRSFEERLGAMPAMRDLAAAMRARPALAAYVAQGGVPFQVTASPSEPVLRSVLADAFA